MGDRKGVGLSPLSNVSAPLLPKQAPPADGEDEEAAKAPVLRRHPMTFLFFIFFALHKTAKNNKF